MPTSTDGVPDEPNVTTDLQLIEYGIDLDCASVATYLRHPLTSMSVHTTCFPMVERLCLDNWTLIPRMNHPDMKQEETSPRLPLIHAAESLKSK